MKNIIALLLIFASLKSTSQVCDPNGNVFIITGFSSDIVQLNIDVPVPNLKIGICTYNAIKVIITGPFVDQIGAIVYAGAGVPNGGACGISVDSVEIIGFPQEAIKLYDLSRGKIGFTRRLGDQASFLPYPTANCIFGPKSACGAVGEEQNNSEAQIAQFFLDEFGEGSSIYAHHYEPFCLSGVISLSEAGNCCEIEDTNPLNPIYKTNHSYHFFENDTIELCTPTITLDLGSYFFPVQNPEFPGVVWNTGATGPILEVSSIGEYSFTAVDICANLANTFLSDTIRVVQCCSQFSDLVIASNLGDTVCVGQEVILSTNYENVNWSTGANSSSIIVTSNLVASASTSIDGCIKTDLIQINFIDPPIISISNQSPICPNANTFISASGADRYRWDSGVIADSILVSSPSDFEISLEGFIGECSADATFNIPVYPISEFSLGPDILLEFPDAIEFSPTPSFDQIEFISDFILNCDNCEEVKVDVQSSGVIIGKYTDDNGCRYHDTLRIDLNLDCNRIFIPNAFSPNDDEINETFCFYSECAENIDLKIYNRLGTLVYQSEDPKLCWDGLYKGERVRQDYYFYILNVGFNDGSSKNIKGYFTLLR
jgi:gliding motility-associated-like protein